MMVVYAVVVYGAHLRISVKIYILAGWLVAFDEDDGDVLEYYFLFFIFFFGCCKLLIIITVIKYVVIIVTTDDATNFQTHSLKLINIVKKEQIQYHSYQQLAAAAKAIQSD